MNSAARDIWVEECVCVCVCVCVFVCVEHSCKTNDSDIKT